MVPPKRRGCSGQRSGTRCLRGGLESLVSHPRAAPRWGRAMNPPQLKLHPSLPPGTRQPAPWTTRCPSPSRFPSSHLVWKPRPLCSPCSLCLWGPPTRTSKSSGGDPSIPHPHLSTVPRLQGPQAPLRCPPPSTGGHGVGASLHIPGQPGW